MLHEFYALIQETLRLRIETGKESLASRGAAADNYHYMCGRIHEARDLLAILEDDFKQVTGGK